MCDLDWIGYMSALDMGLNRLRCGLTWIEFEFDWDGLGWDKAFYDLGMDRLGYEFDLDHNLGLGR